MTNKEFFISTWERDYTITVKAFRSLPTEKDKLDQHHHPKFRSPWELVNHIGPHARELAQAVTEGKSDLVNEGLFPLDGPNIYKSVEDAALDLETSSKKLIDVLKSCSDSDWESKMIPVYWGEMKAMEMPLMQFCWMMLFDTIHHRGQLTSYYRPIGSTQPELMGPTAEVEEAMMAKMN